MKINCGPTRKEKYDDTMRYRTTWHPFFPLWPRRVGPNDCRWLETIYRKGTVECWYDGIDWSYEYKSAEDYAKMEELRNAKT